MKSPLFLFLLLSILSCKKASELPQVITKEAINNETYLTLAGEVISTGDDVTTRGICWSENAIPTVDDEWKLDDSRGLGDFTINIEDYTLGNSFIYYKAFAVNSLGVSYGQLGKIKAYGNPNEARVNSDGCVECDNYAVGDTFELNQQMMIVADRNILLQAIEDGEDLSRYCTSKVYDFYKLFRLNQNSEVNIGTWDVSNVTNMYGVFQGSTLLNPDISNWDVSNVQTMSSMFRGASSFNGNIENWDVSSVVNMNSMFNNASSFNRSIDDWDVSNVTNMYALFNDASSFNSFIGDWDVGSVTNMSDMFRGATAFNQDLTEWCVSHFTVIPQSFSLNSALSASNHPVWGTCP